MADENVRIVISGTSKDAVAAIEGARIELERLDRAAEDADGSISVLDRTNRRLTTGMRDTNRAFTFFNNTVSLVKFPALIAGAGTAAQAVSGLSAGVVSLTGALAPLSGALTAYPALLGSIAQAAGVTQVAFAGISEAMDGNKEAMKGLTAAGRDMVRTLNTYKQLTGGLEQAAQGGLFGGITKGLGAAVDNLDRLQAVVGATSRSLGSLAASAGRLVGREGFGRDFQRIGEGNARIIRELGTGALNLANGLRHVMVEAQPLLRWMTDLGVSASEWVEKAARMNRVNGDMARFFRQTRDVLSDLVSIGGSLASTFREIATAGAPLGRDILDSLVKGADALERWAESTRGRNSLKAWFADARPIIYETGKLVRDVTEAFFSLGTQPGAAEFIKRLRTELLPVLVEVTKTTTEEFGPALMDLLVEAGKLFGNFVGSNGPLIVFVEALGNAAKILNRLIEAIPGLGTALSAALTGFSILKILGLTSVAQFSRAGIVAGNAYARSFQASLAQIGGGGAAGGGGLAALGKRFIGVSLGLGALEGLSGVLSGENVGDSIQNGLSSASMGLIPRARDVGADLGRSIAGGLGPALDRAIQAKDLSQIRKLTIYTEEMIAQFEEAGITVPDELRQIGESGERAAARLHRATSDIRGDIDDMGQKFRFTAREMEQAAQRNFDKIASRIGMRTEQGRKLAAENMGAMARAMEAAMDRGQIAVDKGLKTITKMLGQQLRAFGIDAKQEGKFISTPRRLITPGNASETAQNLGRQGGGLVPGRGSGDKVPLHIAGRLAAMVEPGELVSVTNRNATAALMAANKEVPRFAGGGMVDPAGPGTGLVNKAIAPVVGAWSQKYNAAINYGYDPGGGHTSAGHNVTGTATDTGPAGGWAGESLALFERGLSAVVNAGLTVLYSAADVAGTTNWPGHGPPSVAGGNAHAHIEWGMNPQVSGAGPAGFTGGRVRLPRWDDMGFAMSAIAAGGLNMTSALIERAVNKRLGQMGGPLGGEPGRNFGSLPPSLKKWNRTFAEHNSADGDWGGIQMPFDKIAMLGEWAGMPGVSAAQITIGESNRRPGATGEDPGGTKGYGLWMITTSFHDQAVKPYGGYPGMLNPIYNAIVAEGTYAGAGHTWAPWYGTDALTAPNLHYTGPMRQRGGIVPLLAEGGKVDAVLRDLRKDGATAGEIDRWNDLSDGQRRRHLDELRKLRLPKDYFIFEDASIGKKGDTQLDVSATSSALPRRLLDRMKQAEAAIKTTTGWITDAETLHAAPFGPSGEDLSDGERANEIMLWQAKLANQTDLRRHLKRAIGITRGSRGTKPGRKLYDELRARLATLVGPAGETGEILESRSALWLLQHPDAAGGAGLLAEERAALAEERAAAANRRAALLAAQYRVIPDILRGLGTPFVGAYAAGGVVPRDGLAYVHEGETIVPSPGITINLSGDLASIVRAEIAGQARLIDRTLGAKSRRLSVAPGRA